MSNLVRILDKSTNSMKIEEIARRRLELERKISQNESKLLNDIRRTERDVRRKRIEGVMQRKEELVTEEKSLLMEIDLMKDFQRVERLRHFLYTNCTPRIYWMPSAFDDLFESDLQIKKNDYK